MSQDIKQTIKEIDQISNQIEDVLAKKMAELEKQELLEKAEKRRQRIERERVVKDEKVIIDTGVDGKTIEKQFEEKPRFSQKYKDIFEETIINYSNTAFIRGKFLNNNEKRNIKRYVPGINPDDVVAYRDQSTLFKKDWFIVTPHKIYSSSEGSLSLLGLKKATLDVYTLDIHYHLGNHRQNYSGGIGTINIYNILLAAMDSYIDLWSYARELENQKNYKEAFEYYLEGAFNNSNIDCLNSVGIYYNNGWYVKKDQDRAIEWYKKGAKGGNFWSMSNLTHIYRNRGDYEQSWKYLNQALKTEKGEKDGVLNTAGLMTRDGQGVKPDLQKALQYFEEGSSLGNKYATYNLVDYYIDYKVDYKTAISYMVKGIEQGHSAIEKMLGDSFLYGRGVPIDEKKAAYHYTKAREQNYSGACFGLGAICYRHKEFEKAIEQYKEGIQLKNTFGYTAIGNTYKNKEYEKYDVNEALYWYEKGVEAGSSSAMVQLGHMYRDGNGVIQDYKKAIELYNQAIKKKSIDAYGALGMMYVKGLGVDIDINKAKELFNVALEKNNAYTKYQIAKISLEYHEDFDFETGLQYAFDVAKMKGKSFSYDSEKLLVDYFKDNTYELTTEKMYLIITSFNDVLKKEPEYINHKQTLEKNIGTPIPIYSEEKKQELLNQLDSLSKKSRLEQFSFLLDAYLTNPDISKVNELLADLYFEDEDYENAYFFYKKAFFASDYIKDKKVRCRYYLFKLDFESDYEVGKKIITLINKNYEKEIQLLIQIVCKHRAHTYPYEYFLDVISLGAEFENKYSKEIKLMEEMRNDKALDREFDRIESDDRRLSRSIAQHARRIDARDWRAKKLSQMSDDSVYAHYKNALQGHIPSIRQIIKECETGAVRDYKKLVNIYTLLNESETKEGINILVDYYTQIGNEQKIIDLYRDSVVLDHENWSKVISLIKKDLKFDEAYSNYLKEKIIDKWLMENVNQYVLLPDMDEFKYVKDLMNVQKLKENLSVYKTKTINNQEIEDLYHQQKYDLAFKKAKDLALEHNPIAYDVLGRLCHYGHFVKQDVSKAIEWYKKAYEVGNEKALVHLGDLYYETATTPSDLDKVYQLYKKAYVYCDEIASKRALEIAKGKMSETDLGDDMRWMLKLYEFSHSEYEELISFRYLNKISFAQEEIYSKMLERAKGNEPFAIRLIAASYHLGVYVEKNKEIAKEWENRLYQLLLPGFNPSSIDALLKEVSKYPIDSDKYRIIMDYLESIHEIESVKVNILDSQQFYDGMRRYKEQYGLGIYMNDGNSFKSAPYYLLHGNMSKYPDLPYSKDDVITLFLFVYPTSINKKYARDGIEKFEKIFTGVHILKDDSQPINRSIDQEVDSCYELFDNGKEKEAFLKALDLAKKGNAKAQNMIGFLYSIGKGVDFDASKAFEWYDCAIKQDYLPAHINLGNLYYNYIQNSEGYEEALRHYKIAINSANENVCTRALELLRSRNVPYNQEDEDAFRNRLIILTKNKNI